MKHERSLAALSTVAFGLLLSSSAAAQEAATPNVVPHDTADRAECLACHSGALGGVPAAPASHEGRENDVCLVCHSADSPIQSAVPKAIPHDLAGREQCLMCHSGALEGIPVPPANHEKIDVKYCRLCHNPGS